MLVFKFSFFFFIYIYLFCLLFTKIIINLKVKYIFFDFRRFSLAYLSIINTYIIVKLICYLSFNLLQSWNFILIRFLISILNLNIIIFQARYVDFRFAWAWIILLVVSYFAIIILLENIFLKFHIFIRFKFVFLNIISIFKVIFFLNQLNDVIVNDFIFLLEILINVFDFCLCWVAAGNLRDNYFFFPFICLWLISIENLVISDLKLIWNCHLMIVI